MTVLYVDQSGKLGGGEIAILPWLCHTASEDTAVVLFEDGPFREALEEAGVKVEVMDQNSISFIRRESGLMGLLRTVPHLFSLQRRLAKRASGFDLLYANSQKAFLLSALSKCKHQKLVWHLRDILTAEHFSAVLRRIAVFAGNRYANVIIANSQATADAFIAAGGRPEKIQVIYDGVDGNQFDAVDPQLVTTLRSDLVGSGSETLIGVFGRLSPWKGQHIFLEAISETPNAKGILVGDALFGEDAYVETLRHRALQPDLAGRIVFLGFRRDVPALMKAMDLIVHTSTSPEPFGLVIVEGMLAGKPMVATRAGGAMEIVQDGYNGLLVCPGSAVELKAAFQRVLADGAFASTIARNGRVTAKSRFSLNALYTSLNSVLTACAKDT